jgi:chromate reductase
VSDLGGAVRPDWIVAGAKCCRSGSLIGRVGTAVAQQHLKGVMNYSEAVLMNQPEAYVYFTEEAFPGDGSITDSALAKVLSGYLTAFRDFVMRTVAATSSAPISPR